jgi:hypothetical protein
MSDDLMDPSASEAVNETADADAPQDPVQTAKDEAWLAQFRADNAAKVLQYDFTSAAETQAEEKEQVARRDYDLKQVDSLTKHAADERTEAAAFEKKAAQDVARHDEWEVKAQTDLHMADASEQMAGHFKADAATAEAERIRLNAEVKEEYAIYEGAQKEYEVMQEQAVAAQRIATDEARLPHPGDPPPAAPGEESHKP